MSSPKSRPKERNGFFIWGKCTANGDCARPMQENGRFRHCCLGQSRIFKTAWNVNAYQCTSGGAVGWVDALAEHSLSQLVHSVLQMATVHLMFGCLLQRHIRTMVCVPANQPIHQVRLEVHIICLGCCRNEKSVGEETISIHFDFCYFFQICLVFKIHLL